MFQLLHSLKGVYCSSLYILDTGMSGCNRKLRMGRQAMRHCSRYETMSATLVHAMLDAKCGAFDMAMRSDVFDVCAYRRLCKEDIPV